ncbi:uncharacterized protein LY79DRAFT_356171 [Colletotrichum navitas]|uniref:Uncharacterized protein n=1 Tax=Colletotrichum navitas TaxID=681940 RepID=A0AAD8QB68_9PEZI|nr:uncharacterized protein LY79DRAFT_356171 [Colletotrichum navitas]KAK1597779.1 hypothetical protein LY79DRAFT_356171 [Colletotrichum navitas]
MGERVTSNQLGVHKKRLGVLGYHIVVFLLICLYECLFLSRSTATPWHSSQKDHLMRATQVSLPLTRGKTHNMLKGPGKGHFVSIHESHICARRVTKSSVSIVPAGLCRVAIFRPGLANPAQPSGVCIERVCRLSSPHEARKWIRRNVPCQSEW